MYRKILVPIDGSRTSGCGLDEAIKLAKGQKAVLVILHVVDEMVLAYGTEIGRTFTLPGVGTLTRLHLAVAFWQNSNSPWTGRTDRRTWARPLDTHHS